MSVVFPELFFYMELDIKKFFSTVQLENKHELHDAELKAKIQVQISSLLNETTSKAESYSAEMILTRRSC